ncbi:MAG: hypothetical protein J0L77_07905 [Alphaproteobacteria bacterium]|nr:hypothetical protein [Alphaproteobacteria bacterium]
MVSIRLLPPKNQDLPRQTERGSVILWILIFVALFGALSFAFMSGSRQSGGNLNSEKNRMVSSEIINFGRSMRDAVKTLKIGGCSETQISFQNLVDLGYVNPSAPISKACHVFQASGAGMTWETISTESGGTMGFTGQEVVPNIGTAAPELILKWEGLTLETCEAINKYLNVRGTNNNPPHTTAGTCDLATAGCKFTGAFAAGSNITNAQNDFNGKQTACYNEAGGNNYIYYQVLIAR